PTEAEWEYAARAGCGEAYCARDGTPTHVGHVAWWAGSSDDPTTGEPTAWPVMLLEPNPWGFYDMFGNVSEWTANWYYPYSKETTNPIGPTAPTLEVGTKRGGNAWDTAASASAWKRGGDQRDLHYRNLGFRVLLPGTGG
ncbi:MAG: SUMF1/EgtB/PvdO family nonheme iron enzyme, partial [Holophagales bacterium]|nr:SUMF1/EgtB/PvdO family nonheme iron enzyme [Holophagales bacterium]